MPHELLDLEIHEVSGVDRAANGRKFLVIKRAEAAATAPPAEDVTPAPSDMPVEKDLSEPAPAPMTTGDIINRTDLMERMHRLKAAFAESTYRIFEQAPVEQQPTLLLQSVQEFVQHARQAIAKMATEEDVERTAGLVEELESIAKAGRKISSARMRRLQAILRELEAIMQEVESPRTAEEPPMNKALDDEKVAQLTKRAEAAEADAEALSTKLEERDRQVAELTKRQQAADEQLTKLQAQLDEHDPEAIWKGVSPQLRARIEKAERERDEERQQRKKTEYMAEVAVFKKLPVNPDDDWEVWQDIETLPAKSQRRIKSLFKAAEEGMKYSALFEEVGKNGTGEHKGDAYEQLETLTHKRVQEAQQAGRRMSKAVAWDEVLQENPDLYHQYKVEKARGGN